MSIPNKISVKQTFAVKMVSEWMMVLIIRNDKLY